MSYFLNVLGFQTPTPGYPKQVAVAATSTLLLPKNSSRIYAHVFNNSGVTAYLQFSSDAAINQGIALKPNAMFTVSGFDLWQGDITAVSTLGTINLDVMEAS